MPKSKQIEEETRETVSTRVKPTLWRRLKVDAAEKGVDIADILEALIEKYLGEAKT